MFPAVHPNANKSVNMGSRRLPQHHRERCPKPYRTCHGIKDQQIRMIGYDTSEPNGIILVEVKECREGGQSTSGDTQQQERHWHATVLPSDDSAIDRTEADYCEWQGSERPEEPAFSCSTDTETGKEHEKGGQECKEDGSNNCGDRVRPFFRGDHRGVRLVAAGFRRRDDVGGMRMRLGLWRANTHSDADAMTAALRQSPQSASRTMR